MQSLTYAQVADDQTRRLGVAQRDDTDPSLLYPAYNLSVPIDHFHNESRYASHTSETFNLRYWFDATHYRTGGPVIVLEGGETGGDDRLPFLQKGILYQLAKATHGLGVVLEHRYYGTSLPTEDLSTENLRFLTTEQALADVAYFAKNVKFPGLENCTLNAPDAAWIAYGGSYAGAFVAFLRTQYPDVFYGAISSSGVTEAIYDYWEYYVPIIEHGPQDCIKTTQTFISTIDNILLGDRSSAIAELKSAFGLQNLTHNQDFAYLLSSGVMGWQSRNWDPAVNNPSFDQYCGNVTSDSLIYPNTSSSLAQTVQNILSVGGFDDYGSNSTLVNRMLNYIGYIKTNSVDGCTDSQDSCFSNLNATFYSQDDLSQWVWRSWAYQYCDEWGYLLTGSGYPEDGQPIISRTLDIPYFSYICEAAFGINRTSNVDTINKYGGFGISYPRLAFIDGQADPWREATPHAEVAPKRNSSFEEPFIEMEGAVHHWDENGLFPNETKPDLPPKPISDTQRKERQFVKEWMMEWRLRKVMKGRDAEQVEL
ncbi:peptidase S28 [Rhizodiscina lignyota]|uniref:Peptidase S28 n=1 Tax=Rhizodiscina lignyota TaxID=1504668 RepID=A0A9P4M1Q2_9PEZI|nr:peptidase S28 [Rhizodiscina lignyota]